MRWVIKDGDRAVIMDFERLVYISRRRGWFGARRRLFSRG